MRRDTLTFDDQGTGVTAERLSGNLHTTDVYVNEDELTFYKVIDKPVLLASELFAGKVMDKMTQMINQENQSSTSTNHPSSPRIRTPSPRVCISPTQLDAVALALPSIKQRSITYTDCCDIGSDQIKLHLHQIVRIMTMRQLIQDGDAMGQNYEIPMTQGIEETLSLDYGEAFRDITNSIQSTKRILPRQFLNPKSKEELLVSLLFNKTDNSTQFFDNHSVLQDQSIVSPKKISMNEIVQIIFKTLHSLSCIENEDIESWKDETLKTIRSAKNDQPMETIEKYIGEASQIFSSRLSLAKALFQGDEISLDFTSLADIYQNWCLLYSYDAENQSEIETIKKETDEWLESVKESVKKYNEKLYKKYLSDFIKLDHSKVSSKTLSEILKSLQSKSYRKSPQGKNVLMIVKLILEKWPNQQSTPERQSLVGQIKNKIQATEVNKKLPGQPTSIFLDRNDHINMLFREAFSETTSKEKHQELRTTCGQKAEEVKNPSMREYVKKFFTPEDQTFHPISHDVNSALGTSPR